MTFKQLEFHGLRYTLSEIEKVAYAMFENFDGKIPDAPEGFFSGYGASINGETVTFTPATPEEKQFEWMDYSENSDKSLDAIYYVKWTYDSNWYYVAVHMVPYRGSGSAFKYTIDSVRLDREMEVPYDE